MDFISILRRSLVGGMILLAVSSCASMIGVSSRQAVPLLMVVPGSAGPTQSEVEKGRSLWAQRVVAAGSARIADSLDVAFDLGEKGSLRAGSILFAAAFPGETIYCSQASTPGNEGAQYRQFSGNFVCLSDMNKDQAFDRYFYVDGISPHYPVFGEYRSPWTEIAPIGYSVDPAPSYPVTFSVSPMLMGVDVEDRELRIGVVLGGESGVMSLTSLARINPSATGEYAFMGASFTATLREDGISNFRLLKPMPAQPLAIGYTASRSVPIFY